jgi:type 1 fimbria pilin
MAMQRLDAPAMRGIGRAVFSALSLTVATSAFGTDFRPFPTALSLPKNVPTDTVVARGYVTPQKLCGEAKCRLIKFDPKLVGLGGMVLPVTGPRVMTQIRALDIQAIVDGKPQTQLTEDEPPVEFSSPVEFQLLRNVIKDLVSGESNDVMHFWFFTKTMTGTERILNYIKFNTTVTVLEGTCSVPSQTVELQPARAGSLTGIGTTAGERSFHISINDCPKGYNKVFYTLKPVGDSIENSPGVLPLSPESTAKGVRIKVTDNAGAAVVFDKSTRIDNYDKTTGGSYSIPMGVSYVQTEAKVTPGTVNGAMSVLMEYQ